MAPVKERNKTPDKELDKREPCTLLPAEFKSQVIRMLRDLRARVVELNENFDSKIKTYKCREKT